MKIHVLISLFVAIATNITAVGLYYYPFLTEWILTYVSIASTIWFFVVVFVALFRKIKAF